MAADIEVFPFPHGMHDGHRYQKERASEVASLLRDLAVTQVKMARRDDDPPRSILSPKHPQAQYAAENAQAWTGLLHDIQNQQQQQQAPRA